jgi:hypothetical protein
MIPVKDAVARAVEFALHTLEPSRISDLLLEEVESKVVGVQDVWLITLSMPRPGIFGVSLRAREYKTFTVHGGTGEVLSMKIREVAGTQ